MFILYVQEKLIHVFNSIMAKSAPQKTETIKENISVIKLKRWIKRLTTHLFETFVFVGYGPHGKPLFSVSQTIVISCKTNLKLQSTAKYVF